MKLLFVSKYPPIFGGIAEDTKLLTEVLWKNNEVHVISFSGAKGKNVYHMLNNNFSSYRTALQKIVEIHPDIVHIQHEWGNFGLSDYNKKLIWLIKQLAKKGIKLVITFHNSIESLFEFGKLFGKKRNRKKFNEAYRLLCQHCTVIVPNIQQKEEITKFGTVPHYIPLPLPKTHGQRKTKTKKIALIQGSIHQGKGIETVLKAWKVVHKQHPDAELRVAGGIPKNSNSVERKEYMNRLRGLAADLSKKSIQLDFRLLTEKQYHTNIDTAFFSILPYKTISQSGVLLDNYAHDTPVITSALPFFLDELSKHKTGITCRRPIEYSNAINKLFADPIFYQKIRKNIKYRKRFFQIDKVANQHIIVYRKMMRGE